MDHWRSYFTAKKECMTYEELDKLIKPIPWEDESHFFTYVDGYLGFYNFHIGSFDYEKMESIEDLCILTWENCESLTIKEEKVKDIEAAKALARKWMLEDMLENMFA